MTVKRNGDRVILKGGRVSCSCCEICESSADYLDFPVATKEEFDDWMASPPKTVNASVSSSIPDFGSCSSNFVGQISSNDTYCVAGLSLSNISCESPYPGYSLPASLDITVGIARIQDGDNYVYRVVLDGEISCPVLIYGFFCDRKAAFLTQSVTSGIPSAGSTNFYGRTFYWEPKTGYAGNFDISVSLSIS